jgi:NitT/TauT family transport system ATP-binding protein
MDFYHGTQVIQVLRNLDFHLNPAEFVTILGRSGSGKSTILDLIMGLIKPTSGTIRRSKADFTIGYVFQKPALLPWRNVSQNVALPLQINHVSKKERDELVKTALHEVGMSYAARAYPFQLSGGMAQRAAIARALVQKPDLLLMDEPFGALDPLLRDNLNVNLAKLQQRTGKAVLFVTHSINEAVILSDRIVILEEGRFIESLKIDLPRPRNFETFRTEAFQDMVFHVRQRMPIQPNLPRTVPS